MNVGRWQPWQMFLPLIADKIIQNQLHGAAWNEKVYQEVCELMDIIVTTKHIKIML